MGGLFNLEETKVLVLHKELEYEVEKLKYKKLVCELTTPDQSTRSLTVMLD